MGLQVLAEAQLEALVFRHAATGAGGSLWAWLAVLAAALGLWGIRSAAAVSKSTPARRPGIHAVPTHGEPGHNLRQPKAAPQQQLPQPGDQPSPAPDVRPPSPALDGGDFGFRRKSTIFELRVEEEEVDGVDEGESLEEEEHPWNGDADVVSGVHVSCWWKGDLGWYRYQDIAALNGRVVRLWEDERGWLRRG